MRTQDIKPKIAGEARFPQNVVQFLCEVHELIEQGDERVTTSSDDLIQAEFAYGGLLEDGGDLFSFIYFPQEGIQSTWELELSAADIAVIAKNQQGTLRLWGCCTPGCGNRFGTPDATCFDCDDIDDERDYKRQVLEGLRGCRSQEDWVRQYLRHFPDAHPLQIIGDYNGETQLPKSWGCFSLAEMQALVTRLHNEG